MSLGKQLEEDELKELGVDGQVGGKHPQIYISRYEMVEGVGDEENHLLPSNGDLVVDAL